MSEKMENIVTNDSNGHGYKYASLSDIAKQGYTIPKMKTGTEGTREYVYYYDMDLNEWIRGAEIVVPENIVNKDGKNKMNSAQLYGSALTYARRYSVLMALSLACDDDKEIENLNEGEVEQKASQKQVDYIRKLYTEEEVAKIIAYYNVDTLNDLSRTIASKCIEARNDNH